MSAYFPVSLNLRNRPCLVVGKTPLADEKALALERAGALVTRADQFSEDAAGGVFLIIADVDLATAGRIREFGESRRVFVNVVDKPDFCSFILPSVLHRGDFAIAVSTGGHSPALAAWVRRRLEEQFGSEYTVLLEQLGSTRGLVRQAIPDYPSRKQFYYSLFESGILGVARRQGPAGVKAFLKHKLQESGE